MSLTLKDNVFVYITVSEKREHVFTIQRKIVENVNCITFLAGFEIIMIFIFFDNYHYNYPF